MSAVREVSMRASAAVSGAVGAPGAHFFKSGPAVEGIATRLSGRAVSACSSWCRRGASYNTAALMMADHRRAAERREAIFPLCNRQTAIFRPEGQIFAPPRPPGPDFRMLRRRPDQDFHASPRPQVKMLKSVNLYALAKINGENFG